MISEKLTAFFLNLSVLSKVFSAYTSFSRRFVTVGPRRCLFSVGGQPSSIVSVIYTRYVTLTVSLCARVLQRRHRNNSVVSLTCHTAAICLGLWRINPTPEWRRSKTRSESLGTFRSYSRSSSFVRYSIAKTMGWGSGAGLWRLRLH